MGLAGTRICGQGRADGRGGPGCWAGGKQSFPRVVHMRAAVDRRGDWVLARARFAIWPSGEKREGKRAGDSGTTTEIGPSPTQISSRAINATKSFAQRPFALLLLSSHALPSIEFKRP